MNGFEGSYQTHKIIKETISKILEHKWAMHLTKTVTHINKTQLDPPVKMQAVKTCRRMSQAVDNGPMVKRCLEYVPMNLLRTP